MDPSQKTCLIGIAAIVAVIALVLFLTKLNGNQVTGAYYFSEPTYCTHQDGVTDLECACGKSRVTRGSRLVTFSDLRGRSAEIEGDWCLMRHQRDLCQEICKYSALALQNFGSVPAPTGGRANLLSADGLSRPTYYQGHQNRARAGAYSYITNSWADYS